MENRFGLKERYFTRNLDWGSLRSEDTCLIFGGKIGFEKNWRTRSGVICRGSIHKDGDMGKEERRKVCV